MFEKLMPREERFFELFRSSAELSVKGAHAFRAMLDDLPNVEKHAREIKDIEHKCDEVTHMTVELLHKTFITPLDREDIYQLISKMDDILDFIDGAAMRVYRYGITEPTQEMKDLADVSIKACESVKKAIDKIHDLSFTSGIIHECVEANRLENESDQILGAAKAKLFREENDVKKLIKLKEIYEFLETVTDRCEDVANIIEGIVLEYA
ncbi:MAG: phosphate transport regulator [Bdellovibrionales bacterium RIFOXYD1_FULL_53_11]|nr:MAG: phosphate transport regulator [Bdellovibrionales bacterium RIFOXYD1_FULL_53_11]